MSDEPRRLMDTELIGYMRGKLESIDITTKEIKERQNTLEEQHRQTHIDIYLKYNSLESKMSEAKGGWKAIMGAGVLGAGFTEVVNFLRHL